MVSSMEEGGSAEVSGATWVTRDTVTELDAGGEGVGSESFGTIVGNTKGVLVRAAVGVGCSVDDDGEVTNSNRETSRGSKASLDKEEAIRHVTLVIGGKSSRTTEDSERT